MNKEDISSVNSSRNKTRRIIFNALGIIFTITGVIGIIVPVLPSTVFFIIASGIFIKTNEPMYRWLHSNRLTGSYLRAYTLGEGLNKKSKIRSITLLWLTLLVSSWIVREIIWLPILLLIVGLAVSWHIISIKPHTISPERLKEHNRIMNKGYSQLNRVKG